MSILPFRQKMARSKIKPGQLLGLDYPYAGSNMRVLVYGYLYCTHHLMDLFHLGVVINGDIQALSFAYHPNCMSGDVKKAVVELGKKGGLSVN